MHQMQQKKILKGRRVNGTKRTLIQENIAPSKETTKDSGKKSKSKWNNKDGLNHSTDRMKKESVIGQMSQRLFQNADLEDPELFQNVDLEDPEVFQNADLKDPDIFQNADLEDQELFRNEDLDPELLQNADLEDPELFQNSDLEDPEVLRNSDLQDLELLQNEDQGLGSGEYER